MSRIDTFIVGMSAGATVASGHGAAICALGAFLGGVINACAIISVDAAPAKE